MAAPDNVIQFRPRGSVNEDTSNASASDSAVGVAERPRIAPLARSYVPAAPAEEAPVRGRARREKPTPAVPVEPRSPRGIQLTNRQKSEPVIATPPVAPPPAPVIRNMAVAVELEPLVPVETPQPKRVERETREASRDRAAREARDTREPRNKHAAREPRDAQPTRERAQLTLVEPAFINRDAKRNEVRRSRVELPDVSGVTDRVASTLRLESEGVRRFVIVAICIALIIAFLYTPARELYTSKRDEQILSTRLEQLNTENEKLQRSVVSLQTREGIEDEARKRGYVNIGETSVEVDGLSALDSDYDREVAAIKESESAEQETPFYLVALDFIFQYDAGD